MRATELSFEGMESLYFSIFEQRRRDGDGYVGTFMVKVRDGKMKWVGRWSRATQSCETRQVRKEATVAGQCVCSGQLAPDFFVANEAGT